MERFVFSKLEMWLVMLLLIIALALGGIWAFSVIKYHVFPYRQISDLRAAIKGVPGDDRPLLTRLAGGLVFIPRAFPAQQKATVLEVDQLSSVQAAETAQGPLPVLDNMRFAYFGDTKRYFVVYGSFVFPELEENTGSILIDTDGMVHRAWPASVEGSEFLGMHIGLALGEDGRVATNSKGILTAESWCGGKLWQAPYNPPADGIRREHDTMDGYDWHHDITYYNGDFYTFVGPDIGIVDALTGEIRQLIGGLDMMRWAWRDGLSIMDTRNNIFIPDLLTPETAAELMAPDPFHFNKVDVVTAELAPEYPMFREGDLLVSLRELNLLVVVRPDEERIVWWRYGLTSRQHDATLIDGAIEVFNNAPFTSPPKPTIRRVFVDRVGFEDIFDLSQWKMIMRQKGNFERRGDRLLTVDDNAGRVIAGKLSGDIEFDFENGYAAPGEEPENLQLRSAVEISEQNFIRFQAQCDG